MVPKINICITCVGGRLIYDIIRSIRDADDYKAQYHWCRYLIKMLTVDCYVISFIWFQMLKKTKKMVTKNSTNK